MTFANTILSLACACGLSVLVWLAFMAVNGF